MVNERDDLKVMLDIENLEDTGALEDRLAGGTPTPIASNIARVEIDHKSLLLLILESSKFGKTMFGNLRRNSCLRQ